MARSKIKERSDRYCKIKFTWLTFSFRSWLVNWNICQFSHLIKICPALKQDAATIYTVITGIMLVILKYTTLSKLLEVRQTFWLQLNVFSFNCKHGGLSIRIWLLMMSRTLASAFVYSLLPKITNLFTCTLQLATVCWWKSNCYWFKNRSLSLCTHCRPMALIQFSLHPLRAYLKFKLLYPVF